MNLLKAFKPTPITTPDIRSVPSIVNQTGWECAFFDFGKASKPNVDYFNCGLVEHHGELWLVTRRATWDKRDKLGFNDIVAFCLDKNLKPQVGRVVGFEKRWDYEHFEDPRAYSHEGRTFVSCCNFIRDKRGCTYPHQIIAEVSHDWSVIRRYDPVYGHNGKDTAYNSKHEKNWVFFWHLGNPHLVYTPGLVAELKPDFQLHREWKSFFDYKAVWNYGEIRGGTPPVLVNGEYITFFHSATPYNTTKRQYHMGAYTFSATPPFNITSITLEPLLSGSAQDGGLPGKPPCTFCNGSLLRGKEWLITMGVNDLRCAYIKIPHKDLMERLVEL